MSDFFVASFIEIDNAIRIVGIYTTEKQAVQNLAKEMWNEQMFIVEDKDEMEFPHLIDVDWIKNVESEDMFRNLCFDYDPYYRDGCWNWKITHITKVDENVELNQILVAAQPKKASLKV
jgi:hypothetical protein